MRTGWERNDGNQDSFTHVAPMLQGAPFCVQHAVSTF